MCPGEHYTHTFLACDPRSACYARDFDSCLAPLTPLPPSFTCKSGVERVPYMLVCDHRPDCADRSDEDFCAFPACMDDEIPCGHEQCVSTLKVCDGLKDCVLGHDENTCEELTLNVNFNESSREPAREPPGLLDISRTGTFTYDAFVNNTCEDLSSGNLTCPETHFSCPSVYCSYCYPVFLRCNGVYDCPYHEDEADCHSYTCPGFYRCRDSFMCLHQRYLCDGIPHCPNADDELLCDFTCPVGCTCHGLAFFCTRNVGVFSAYSALRYLHATGTLATMNDVKNNSMLIFLSLAQCQLHHLFTDHSFPNLRTLDLSDNGLSFVDDLFFSVCPSLAELILSGNPLQHPLIHSISRHRLRVQLLDLSRVYIEELDSQQLTRMFPRLQTLNLSDSGLQRITGKGFSKLQRLRAVDLRGCPISQFPQKVFQDLPKLTTVWAQTFTLCCPVLLPADFNPLHCQAPADPLSSCDDLLGSLTYTISLFVFSVLALGGNCVTFIFRTCWNDHKGKLGFSVLVTHLAVADLLMGVYLAIIGAADRILHGQYVWNDVAWRHSAACSLAGFVSLLSSEVSAFILCLITLDRFLVLRFPFSRLHFSCTSAHVASVMAWVLGITLALIPLTPLTSHWQFYSQTGICIPLPIINKDFPGRLYSFGIVIVFNFVLFVFISVGQLIVYWSVRANAMSMTNSSKTIKDLTIARRLITVAMSDFLCWFPIGVLGLLAAHGVSISKEINVGMAVFVLPLNSALNPFIYTVNIILERRRRSREERLRKFLTEQINKKQLHTNTI